MSVEEPNLADTSPQDDAPATQAPATQAPTTDAAPSIDSLQTRAPSSYPDTRNEAFDTPVPVQMPVDTYATVFAETSAFREAPPETFPGYELLETLGEGGMGTVYKARQEGLNRLVALKVILGGRRAGPKDLIRFLAEAEAVASIKHPHVVQIHEYGEVDGRPFLTLEYLPGGTLAERLKTRQRLEPSEAAKLARAVQEAHDQGIVHRDLKPANVLFDAQDEPKVTDFGLAKQGKGTDLTQTQAVMGTPAYMSPEQAKGETKFVGPPADIYALGVILYECLTGVRPFQDTDTHVLLRKVIEDEPRSPTRHVPGLPRDLGLIALKCLAKDPADRYPTAAVLAEDLAHFLAGEPVSVRASGTVERTLKWARRKPTLAAAYVLTATVFFLVLVGVSLVFLWRDAVSARNGELLANEKLARVEYGRTIQVAHQEWRDNNIVATLALLDGIRSDRRGWEWRYLNHLCHAELIELGQSISSVSWSPDGSRLAVDNGDMAQVLDARTGAETVVLKGHTLGVTSIAWNHDGSRIATASRDKTVRLWDAHTGAEMLVIYGITDRNPSVSWNSDGSRIAVTGNGPRFKKVSIVNGGSSTTTIEDDDKEARVWDARNGGEIPMLKGHTDLVMGMAWSPDGSRIATASMDKSARVWDARTGAEVHMLKGHTHSVISVSWSPDGSRIATASNDGTARVWDARTGTEVFTLAQDPFAKLISWNPDGSRIATASNDGTARVWDARTGTEMLLLKGHTEPINSVSWSPDGSRIATASMDKTARLWDARTGTEVLSLKGHTKSIDSLTWSPDGSRIATTSFGKNTTRVWDTRISAEAIVLKQDGLISASWSPDGSRIATASGFFARVRDARTGVETISIQDDDPGFVFSASWSPDGSRIATTIGGNIFGSIIVDGKPDTSVRIYDIRTGGEILVLKGHADLVTAVAWSPDGSRIATASYDKTARVWDARTGAEIITLNGHTEAVSSVAWSPDGSRIATASKDQLARVWDARTGTEVRVFKGHTSSVNSVSWTPNGLLIATASSDGTARVWNANTGDETLVLYGHLEPLTSVVWSPDGSRIATASFDKTARVWDAITGTEVLRLKGHANRVNSVAWSRDGSRIVTASDDGTARVWDSRIKAELEAGAR